MHCVPDDVTCVAAAHRSEQHAPHAVGAGQAARDLVVAEHVDQDVADSPVVACGAHMESQAVDSPLGHMRASVDSPTLVVDSPMLEDDQGGNVVGVSQVVSLDLSSQNQQALPHCPSLEIASDQISYLVGGLMCHHDDPDAAVDCLHDSCFSPFAQAFAAYRLQ